MKITFDKRTYNIEDGDNKYEVIHIVRHPIPEYDDDTYYVHEYRDFGGEMIGHATGGFFAFKPSEELLNKIKETVKNYEQSR